MSARGSRPAPQGAAIRRDRGHRSYAASPRVALFRFSHEEQSVIRSALYHAILSVASWDKLGPLAEFRSTRRKGTVRYDHEGARKNADIARAALAKFVRRDWGVATIDSGILCAKPTRRAALLHAGFATRITRERQGRLWVYTSQEGTQATIGRIADLLAAGFQLVQGSGE